MLFTKKIKHKGTNTLKMKELKIALFALQEDFKAKNNAWLNKVISS